MKFLSKRFLLFLDLLEMQDGGGVDILIRNSSIDVEPTNRNTAAE